MSVLSTYTIVAAAAIAIGVIISGFFQARDGYFEPDALVVWIVASVIWPISLVVIGVIALVGAVFGIGYLIGKFYRIFKPTTEVPND